MNKTEPKTKAIAFLVVPNDHTRQLIKKKSHPKDSPLLAPLKAALNGYISAEIMPRNYQYLFMICFEDTPGAEAKVFNALNNRFSDIAAGLNSGWSMKDASQFMQESVLEESGIITCCIPTDIL